MLLISVTSRFLQVHTQVKSRDVKIEIGLYCFNPLGFLPSGIANRTMGLEGLTKGTSHIK